MNEDALTPKRVRCPYCDAPFDLLLDVSQGSQLTWEDCHVCCAPIQVRIEADPGDPEALSVSLGRDDEVL
uniref:CPXCG motif-containing cysteine-rich protein n=1 Tax=uncultured Halomonas sp. TaxID=173971 RepID=UPI0026062DBD|nr:CPXCG motif-containing cysteine-rich protein [uncultured Halomonas sp.]